MVVLPVDHPLAHEKEITAAQLDGVNFVSTDPVYSGSLAPIVKAWFAQENSQPNIVRGNEYSGDHESGGHGAGRHFDTRLYE